MLTTNDRKTQIDAFKKRISENREKALSRNYLIQPVHKRDKGIFNSSLSQMIFLNVFNRIMQDQEILQQLNDLEPGKNIYVKRPANSKDTRTFNICMDENGEVCLFIEPKSKRFDNTRRLLKWVGGTYKTRKICVRADLPIAKPFVSMIEYIRNEKKFLDRFNNELKFAQKFSGKLGFAKGCIFGGSREKMRNGVVMIRMITYADYMPSDVYKYLEGIWSPPGLNFTTPSKEDKQEEITALRLKALKYDVLRQIINIVARMHDEQAVHGDLKPENFLIKYNYDTARFEVEIIDFGFASDFNNNESTQEVLRGTPWYMPPWLIQASAARTHSTVTNLEISNSQAATTFRRNFMPTLGWRVLRNTLSEHERIRSQPAYKNTGEKDIWALGIMCDEFIYGIKDIENSEYLAEEVNDNPLLKRIFNLTDDAKQNIKPENLPSIHQLQQLFAEDEEIKAALAYLPTPQEAFYDSTIDNAENEEDQRYIDSLNVDAFSKTMDAIGDYAAKMDALISSNSATNLVVDKIEIAADFLKMSPIEHEVKYLTAEQFNFLHNRNNVKDSVYRAGYIPMTKFVEYMTKPQKIADLNKYAAELKELLDSISTIQNSAPTPSEEAAWIEDARWELFLRTALCLTYMRIKDLANGPQTNWLAGSRISSGLYSQLKTCIKPEAKIDYTQEILAQRMFIDELVPALRAEINPKNFQREFGAKFEY